MQLFNLQMFKEVVPSRHNSLDYLVLLILDYRLGVIKPQFRAFKKMGESKTDLDSGK